MPFAVTQLAETATRTVSDPFTGLPVDIAGSSTHRSIIFGGRGAISEGGEGAIVIGSQTVRESDTAQEVISYRLPADRIERPQYGNRTTTRNVINYNTDGTTSERVDVVQLGRRPRRITISGQCDFRRETDDRKGFQLLIDMQSEVVSGVEENGVVRVFWVDPTPSPSQMLRLNPSVPASTVLQTVGRYIITDLEYNTDEWFNGFVPLAAYTLRLVEYRHA